MNLQRQRQKTIATEQAVSYAFILPENLSTKSGREELIRALRPDFYAVSENTPHLKEKRRIMKKFGGKLRVVHRYNPQVSSTKIITNQRLVHRRKKPTNI